MKPFTTLAAMSLTLFVSHHTTNAMDQVPASDNPRSSSRRGSFSSGSFSKRLTSSKGGNLSKSDASRSPSPSPKKLTKHIIWLFDKHCLPRKKISLKEVGVNSLAILHSTLDEFHINTFLVINSDEISTLDDDCLGAIMTVLKKFECEIIVLPDTIEPFCTLMDQNKEKIIGVYGISDNATMYKMLACWSSSIIANLVIQRDDIIEIQSTLQIAHSMKKFDAHENYTCRKILDSKNSELLVHLVKYIVGLAYQRLIFFHESIDDYLSPDEQDTVKTFCLHCLLTNKKNDDFNRSFSRLVIEND